MSGDFRVARTVDGAAVVAANTWPIEQSVVWCGESDHIPTGTIGGGQYYRVQTTTAGNTDLESQYLEEVRLGGGYLFWEGAAYGDYAEMKVFAPATVAVSNPGAGEYGKLDLGGGAHVYVPGATPGADGPDWDIDLSETLNANVAFTKAVPVPAVNGDGFFTYADELLTSTPGTGTHNLFDFQLDLNEFVRKMWLLGANSQSLTILENIPAVLLPQWRGCVRIHKEAVGGTLNVVWTMLISRSQTV